MLTCAAGVEEQGIRVAVGARPAKAVLVKDREGILNGFSQMDAAQKEAAAEAFAAFAAETVATGSNMRASAQYRTLLVKVLVKRALKQAGGVDSGN